MQNYKNLAKKLFTSQNNNFAEFAQTTDTLQFVDKLQPKTYYETYKDLYFGAKFFAVLAQVATAISSYSFFAELFQTKITNQYLLVSSVVLVLAIIETMKYLTLNKALLSLFSLPAKPNFVLLAFALILSICSIYASVIGGGNLGIDTQKVVTVKSEFDTEIANLRNEIKDIAKRNTYKGNTYIAGKEKALLHQKESALQAMQAKKDNELNKVNAENENKANTFKIGFGIFDLLFLLCTLYVWNFIRKVAIESLANDLPQVPATPAEDNKAFALDNKVIAIENTNVDSQGINENTNTQINAIPNQHNKIGFHYDFTHLKNKEKPNKMNDTVLDDNVGTNKMNDLPTVNVNNSERITVNVDKDTDSICPPIKVDMPTVNVNSERIVITLQANEKECLHCQKVFSFKHWNAKYCSETCRIGAWELRTGKTFTKPKTK